MVARSLEVRQARDLLRAEAKATAPKPKAEPKPKGKWMRPALPPRVKLTDEQKAAVHRAHEGLCCICGQPVPMYGPEVQYDHKLERWERVDDSLDNMGPAHTVPCHARKSAQKTAERAHVDAMGRKHAGEKKPGKKWPSRPMPNGYRPFAASRRG